MCASARAQVRPKSHRPTTASKRVSPQSKSPVDSTPLGDHSVVRALRVWMVANVDGVRLTLPPGQARVRRRRKLAECNAKERCRRNGPALLCLFGVTAFASELVGVWMSTLDESLLLGAARHASTSCNLLGTQSRPCERKRERARSERARGRERAIDGGSDESDDSFARGNKQPPLSCVPLSFPGLSRFLQSKTPSFRPSYLGRKQAI